MNGGFIEKGFESQNFEFFEFHRTGVSYGAPLFPAAGYFKAGLRGKQGVGTAREERLNG
jgi:hypothetical protein